LKKDVYSDIGIAAIKRMGNIYQLVKKKNQQKQTTKKNPPNKNHKKPPNKTNKRLSPSPNILSIAKVLP